MNKNFKAPIESIKNKNTPSRSVDDDFNQTF